MSYARSTFESPVGPLCLAASKHGVTHLKRLEHAERVPAAEPHPAPAALRHLASATRALAEYFAGERKDFDDLELAPEGTRFQLSVWRALQRIPYGTTTSYGALARSLGNANASRAVGLANGRNPIGIVIPCHRVIGADGSLTGYGGGLPMKQWLLRLEGALPSGLL